jgi:hypothetical protein
LNQIRAYDKSKDIVDNTQHLAHDFVYWSPTAGGRTDFYSDWHCRNTYRDHMRTFFNRKNSITGVMYKAGESL